MVPHLQTGMQEKCPFLLQISRLTASRHCTGPCCRKVNGKKSSCVTLSLLFCFLHDRVGRMSGSNMEMDRCGQHGSVESPTSSLRGLSNSSLPMASTDNLAATDTGKQLILNQLIKIIIAVINIRVIQLKRAWHIYMAMSVNFLTCTLGYPWKLFCSFMTANHKGALCSELTWAATSKQGKEALQGFTVSGCQLVPGSFFRMQCTCSLL